MSAASPQRPIAAVHPHNRPHPFNPAESAARCTNVSATSKASIADPAKPTPILQAANGRGPASSRTPMTPLSAVMVFTFLNSLGGGVVTTGFSFLSESAYGFSPGQNYWLGLAQGVTYIVGALGVGPVMTAAMRRSRRVSPRLVLGLLTVALAMLCALPWLISSVGMKASWPFWVLVTGYSVLTGVLWPVTESYLSGGRSGPVLRSATGLFNVVWSSALVVAYWAMGPMLGSHALLVIVGVGALHLTSIGLLGSFTVRPAEHVHEEHSPTPEVYPRLLAVFRMQLPTSYLVYSALTPFLPLACAELGITTDWKTPLVSVWLASRVLTFAVLQRWHGWHGRWATTLVGSMLLLTGFGVAVLSTAAAAHWGIGRAGGVAALVLGLAVFGVGMGVIYSSAIYYALAVGRAEVDAGGKHEALIGAGYGAGPVCGLVAVAAANAGWLRPDAALGPITGGQFQVLMLLIVAAIAGGVVAMSLWRARSHSGKAMEAASRNFGGRIG